MVSLGSKKVLTNLIKHTESHNRRLEEQDMWQLRLGQKRKTSGSCALLSKTTCRSNKLNHPVNRSRDVASYPQDTTASAELQKYEESLGEERWGHGGYKELYPEEFQGLDQASSSTHSPTDKRSPKKKKAKQDRPDRKELHKLKKKKKEGKKSKHKKSRKDLKCKRS